MTARRPWRIEGLAARLVPPAAAEHVLGDLAECSPTAGRYAANLASILPRVVWSQIRRRATIGFIAVNAVFTGIALLLALRSAPVTVEGWTVLRAAAPWAAWITGCALAAAYGPVARPQRWSGRLFATTLGATLATAWMAGVPLAAVALAIGGLIGIFLMLAFPVLKHGVPPPLSIDTVAQHARLFQSHIRWRNAREALAVVVVVSANAGNVLERSGTIERLGHLLLIAGALFVFGFLYARAGARRVPADVGPQEILRFHEREVTRQRDILRMVPAWYLLPFVPGLLLQVGGRWGETSAASVAGAAVGVAIVFAFVWWLNVAGARFLDAEICKVRALTAGA